MKINIKYIAKLANLSLTSEEEKRFEKQLEETLATINTLNEIETQKTDITSQVTGLENVMEEDNVQPSLSQQEALANAKNTYNGYFVVKAIFAE
jgi:aspartyl-tRNA(Asn)/glutamyl-tRNA(Gln) amidotransferase subunit C